MDEFRVDDTICPECRAGKHWNCDGVGNVDDDGNDIPCACIEEKYH